MVSRIVLFILLLPISVVAQESDFERKGNLLTSLTIAPVIGLADQPNRTAVHGYLKYFVSNQLSVEGESYLQAGKNDLSENFERMHSIFFGASWHFLSGNIDPYIGFHPGIQIVEPGAEIEISQSKLSLVPAISAQAGMNYFMGEYFHLFVNLRYVNGLTALPGHSAQINDLRFSGGLGLNLNVLTRFKKRV